MAAAHHGHVQLFNRSPARGLVIEYLEQKRLAKMGFTQPVSEASPFALDVFLTCDAEFDRLRAQDREKEREKAERKRQGG